VIIYGVQVGVAKFSHR